MVKGKIHLKKVRKYGEREKGEREKGERVSMVSIVLSRHLFKLSLSPFNLRFFKLNIFSNVESLNKMLGIKRKYQRKREKRRGSFQSNDTDKRVSVGCNGLMLRE